eukprot:jgi/Bigna1/75980/fgenesh1_pg.38_\
MMPTVELGSITARGSRGGSSSATVYKAGSDGKIEWDEFTTQLDGEVWTTAKSNGFSRKEVNIRTLLRSNVHASVANAIQYYQMRHRVSAAKYRVEEELQNNEALSPKHLYALYGACAALTVTRRRVHSLLAVRRIN